MKTYCLTEEDIENVFIFWAEDALIGKSSPPKDDTFEDKVLWMANYFTKLIDVVITVREEYENNKGLRKK